MSSEDKRLTELDPISSPASGDYLYIVDRSDTTDSPDGTSKRVTVSDLVTDPATASANNYTTVAAMVADDGLGPGDIAFTEGQSTAGDGGAGMWVYDSAVPPSTFNDDTSKGIFAYANGKATNGCMRRVLGAVPVDVSIPVGSGERFTTVNGALDVVNALQSTKGTTITLELQTGFVMAEQVIVSNGQDLSNIMLTSVDAQVSVTRTALTQSSTGLSGFQGLDAWIGLFMAGNNATLPRIGTIFSFDSSGTADFNRNGIFITNGSKCIVQPDCGVHDTDGNGALVRYSSTLVAAQSTWDNNARDGASTSKDVCAVRGEFQSIISLQEATITNSGGEGVLLIGASIASLRNASITDCVERGIYGGGCSVIHARGVSVLRCDTGIYAYEGCAIRLLSSTIDDSTSNGIYIDSNAQVNCATGVSISDNGAYGVRITAQGRFSATSPTIDSNTSGGVFVANGDAYISGGSVKDNGGDDLSISGGNATIRLSSTVETTSGTTSDNNVTDSNVAAFNMPVSTGVGGIYGRGGKTSARGTATIASGSTSIAVTHGVDFTPQLTEVSVAPTNDWNLATRYWITNMTATQFTINCSPDPGAGGFSFGWNVQRIIG